MRVTMKVNECINNETISEKIRNWAIGHNITNAALNDLIVILREFVLPLPKDARTLKRTPKDAPIQSMGEGFYIHYGIEDALTDFLISNEFNKNEIELDFNIDGLPLCKSSNKQVWPILGNVVDSSFILVIGVYEGYSKPKNNNEFLNQFVEELNSLISNGFNFQNIHFRLKVRCFIMDAPARAFVLGIKGHTGFFSCTRCNEKGEMFRNRLVF